MVSTSPTTLVIGEKSVSQFGEHISCRRLRWGRKTKIWPRISAAARELIRGDVPRRAWLAHAQTRTGQWRDEIRTHSRTRTRELSTDTPATCFCDNWKTDTFIIPGDSKCGDSEVVQISLCRPTMLVFLYRVSYFYPGFDPKSKWHVVRIFVSSQKVGGWNNYFTILSTNTSKWVLSCVMLIL